MTRNKNMSSIHNAQNPLSPPPKKERSEKIGVKKIQMHEDKLVSSCM